MTKHDIGHAAGGMVLFAQVMLFFMAIGALA